MRFSRVLALLQEARQERAFPVAVCEVGSHAGPVWTQAVGTLTYAEDAPEATVDTIFDLASLTKVICTTSIAMALVRTGALSLDSRVIDLLPQWQGASRSGVTVQHLLEHSSGLPAHVPLWDQAGDRDAFIQRLLSVDVEYPAGSAAVYSDVGFLLLGLVIEEVAGTSLDVLWRELWHAPSSVGLLDYLPLRGLDCTRWSGHPKIAPTEVVPERGGEIRGEVHDENAAALGGVAAHAGLFGTAGSVGLFAQTILQSFRAETPLASPDLMRRFVARSAVVGSSRALGWDTMLPTSSCGTMLSRSAIGHTGFTGTSLWIDWERDLYVVLLTNRVHPTRRNERFLPYRARVHDAIAADLLS